MYAQKYGAKKPLEWTERHEQSFLDRRALWNDLVEVYRQARVRERELYSAADPEIESGYAEVDALDLALDAQPRQTDEERAAWRDILAQLKSTRAALWTKIRELKLGAEIKAQIRTIWQETQRATYTLACGKARKYPALHWADCNDLHDSLWKSIRAKKHPRPRTFTSRESLYRQLQSQTVGGVRVEVPDRKRRKIEGGTLTGATWDALTSERGYGGVKIQPYTLRRATRRWALLEFSIDSGATLRIPIRVHREPPKEALIKGVRVVRERIPGRRFPYEWSVVLSVAAEPLRSVIRCPSERTLYAGLGWRHTPEGLRVLAGIDDLGREWHVTLPEEYVLQWRYSRSLEAHLRLLRNAEAARLGVDPRSTRELFEHPDSRRWAYGEHLGEQTHAALLARNCEAAAAAEIFGERAGRARFSGLRSTLLRRRKDLYIRVARQIVGSSTRLVLGALDGADIQERTKDLPLPARHLRTIAAPTRLRDEIEWQARKAGVEVVTLDATNASRYCAVHPDVDLYAGRDESRLWLACEGCGVPLDRDANYARNLFRRDAPERFERCDWQALTRERSRLEIPNITHEVQRHWSTPQPRESRVQYTARLALANRDNC